MSVLKPVVRCMLLCEHLTWDLDRKTYLLDNPQHRIRLPAEVALPVRHPGLWAYVQLADAVGTFEYSIRVVYDLNRNVIARTRPFRLGFDFDQRLLVRERSIRITPFPVRRPGLYDFQFLCDDTQIASATLILEVWR